MNTVDLTQFGLCFSYTAEVQRYFNCLRYNKRYFTRQFHDKLFCKEADAINFNIPGLLKSRSAQDQEKMSINNLTLKNNKI
jgi:hypothetical protein